MNWVVRLQVSHPYIAFQARQSTLYSNMRFVLSWTSKKSRDVQQRPWETAVFTKVRVVQQDDQGQAVGP